MVGARVEAHAAVDALLLVDVGLLVAEGDGALGADLAAGVRQAALAGVGHAVDVVVARVAGKLDDVDQGRLVVGLGDGGVGEAVGEALALVHALERQAHGQADALLHDRALQEDRLAVGGNVAGDDLVREVADLATGGLLVVLGHVVGDLGHVGEHVATDLGQVGVDAAHGIGHGCPSPGSLVSCRASPQRRSSTDKYRTGGAPPGALSGEKGVWGGQSCVGRSGHRRAGHAVSRRRRFPLTGWSSSSRHA